MLTLDDFAEKLQKPKRGRDYVLGLCIFHDNQDTPALIVYERTRHFECFSCGAKGSWDQLYDSLDDGYHGWIVKKVDRTPARSTRPDWYIGADWGGIPEYVRRTHKSLVELEQTHWYLEDRGIKPLIQSCRLGWDRGWLVVPVYAPHGQVLGTVARAYPHVARKTGMRFDMPAGQPPLLYVPSWDNWRKGNELFIVFGVIDALSLTRAGLAVASPTAGKGSVDPAWLDEYRKPVIIVPDRGEADAAYGLASKLDWRGRVYNPEYGTDEKDPNDLLVNRGVDGLRKELINAMS